MQGHRICSQGHSATDERTVKLSPDEIVLFAKDARAKVASAGDELAHCYHPETTLAEIEQIVNGLNVGLRMVRAIELSGVFPVDPDTLDVLERNRAATAEQVAADEKNMAAYDERGAESYRDRFSASTLKAMSAADLIEDVKATREQLAHCRDELAIYTEFLTTWEDRKES